MTLMERDTSTATVQVSVHSLDANLGKAVLATKPVDLR